MEKEATKFSELHDRRAQVMVELYKFFVYLEQAMRDLTHPAEMESGLSKEELRKEAADAGANFEKYYKRHKVYFPPKVCETVEDMREEMKDVFDDWMVYSPDGERPGQEIDFEQWLDLWEKVTEDDVNELKRELEVHFRELLGVKVDQPD